MKRKKLIYCLLIISITILTSCLKKENYPLVPVLKYEDFIKIPELDGIDKRGVLKLSFTDGDGNIGLDDNDKKKPYDYNLFISFYEIQKGVPTPVKLDGDSGVSFNARIPVITPKGKNKSISGTIEDTVYINNFLSPYDTIFFEVYIVDRDLNKSNVVTTPYIIVKKK